MCYNYTTKCVILQLNPCVPGLISYTYHPCDIVLVMNTVELLKKLAGTPPVSPDEIFWNFDVLLALEGSLGYTFTNDKYIELLEEFLPKIEMDFEGRAEDYAEDLWKIGDVSKLGELDVDLNNIVEYMDYHNFFYEEEIRKETVELRALIDVYKRKKGMN